MRTALHIFFATSLLNGQQLQFTALSRNPYAMMETAHKTGRDHDWPAATQSVKTCTLQRHRKSADAVAEQRD